VTVTGAGTPVALDMSTTNGRQTIDAPTDPNAARWVTIRTTNGAARFLQE
jgi:hypothetical protein